MQKPALLGLFLCVSLGYALLRQLRGHTDQIPFRMQEHLGRMEPPLILYHLLLDQTGKAVTDGGRTTQEEGARYNVIDPPILIIQRTVQGQPPYLPLLMTDQGHLIGKWVERLDIAAYDLLHFLQRSIDLFGIRNFARLHHQNQHNPISSPYRNSSISSGRKPSLRSRSIISGV